MSLPPLTVSVIIPAYKASATIGRALDSLLAQTHPPDEILVVDDGSPDDLAGALEPYCGRGARKTSEVSKTSEVLVQVLRQPNGGASSARNLGIERSRGELLAFLDADDYFEPAKIERQLRVFQGHPEVGLCASRYYAETPETGLRVSMDRPERPVPRDRVIRPAGPEVFDVASNILTTTVMVRRSALGSQRFDTRLKTAEDIELWIRLVQAGPIYLFSEPMATMVLVPGSLSRSDLAGDCVNMLEVIRRHGHLLGRAARRYWEARVYRNWAAGYLGAGDSRKALLPAWKRWLRQPWSAQAWWIVFKSAARYGTGWGGPRQPRPAPAPQTGPDALRAECR